MDNEFGNQNEFVDSKGRKHTDYIHQDYRSVDGYECINGFYYNEIINRDDFIYYKNIKNDLFKVNKDSNDISMLTMKKVDFENWLEWKKCNIDLKDVNKLEDFNEVISSLNRLYYM